MRTFDANNELILFSGPLLKAVAAGTLDGKVSHVTLRIEDENGVDISHLVRDLVIEQNQIRGWAQLELDRAGFDGPFCTPQLGMEYWSLNDNSEHGNQIRNRDSSMSMWHIATR